ncbi:protein kinase family protein [Spongorhabdus nitratireducens]
MARTIQSLEWTSIEIKEVYCTYTHRGIVEIELAELAKNHEYLNEIRVEPVKLSDHGLKHIRNMIRASSRKAPKSFYSQSSFCLSPNSREQYVLETPGLHNQLIIVTPRPGLNIGIQTEEQNLIIFPDLYDGSPQLQQPGLKAAIPIWYKAREPWYAPIKILRSRLIDWLQHDDLIPPLYQLSCVTLSSKDETSWLLDCHRSNGKFCISSLPPSGVVIKRQSQFDDTATISLPSFTLKPQPFLQFMEEDTDYESLNFTLEDIKQCCRSALNSCQNNITVPENCGFQFKVIDCTECKSRYFFGKSMLGVDCTEHKQSPAYFQCADCFDAIEPYCAKKLHMTGYHLFRKGVENCLLPLSWSSCSTTEWCIAFSLNHKGQPLLQPMTDPTNMALTKKILIGLLLIQAIDYFHSKNLTHLNLQLSHIFYNHDLSRIYLTNPGFGFPAAFAPITCMPYDDLPHMFAPELLLGGCSEGTSIDMWLLGLALYGLFANAEEIPLKILEGGGFDPSPFLSSPIGIQFLYLCTELLSCHPADRPCAHTVRNRLKNIQVAVDKNAHHLNGTPFNSGQAKVNIHTK